MSQSLSSSRVAEALARAGQHGLANRLESSPFSPATTFSIAISRQVGARGTSVARAVGKLLEWPVYDQELLCRVAHEMHLPTDRVANVDEKPVSWLQECFQALSSSPHVTEEGYVRHLLETLFLLGADRLIFGLAALATAQHIEVLRSLATLDPDPRFLLRLVAR